MDIKFFTPVHYEGFKTKGQKRLEAVDSYFGWWKDRAVVVIGQIEGKEEWTSIEKAEVPHTFKHLLLITAICLSYLTGIVPLAMLIAKKNLRAKHAFHLINSSASPKNLGAFGVLPKEVCAEVFQHLDPNAIGALSQTSKDIQQLIEESPSIALSEQQALKKTAIKEVQKTHGKMLERGEYLAESFAFALLDIENQRELAEACIANATPTIPQPIAAYRDYHHLLRKDAPFFLKGKMATALFPFDKEKSKEIFGEMITTWINLRFKEDESLKKELLEAKERATFEEIATWGRGVMGGDQKGEGYEGRMHESIEVKAFAAASALLPVESRKKWLRGLESLEEFGRDPMKWPLSEEGFIQLTKELASCKEEEKKELKEELFSLAEKISQNRALPLTALMIALADLFPEEKKEILDIAKEKIKLYANPQRVSREALSLLISLANAYEGVDEKASKELIEAAALSYQKFDKHTILYSGFLHEFFPLEVAFFSYFLKRKDKRSDEFLRIALKNAFNPSKIEYDKKGHQARIAIETLSLSLLEIDPQAGFQVAKKLLLLSPSTYETFIPKWLFHFLKKMDGLSPEKAVALLNEITGSAFEKNDFLGQLALARGWKEAGNEEEAFRAIQKAFILAKKIEAPINDLKNSPLHRFKALFEVARVV